MFTDPAWTASPSALYGRRSTGWSFPARVPGMRRRRLGLRGRCALCCLPAPGFRREETDGPAREVPFLPNPRLRRLQDYRGRSVFSLLDSLPHWSGSPPKSFFFQRNLVSCLCNKARIYLLFIHLPAPPFLFFDCHPSFWRKIEYVFLKGVALVCAQGILNPSRFRISTGFQSFDQGYFLRNSSL